MVCLVLTRIVPAFLLKGKRSAVCLAGEKEEEEGEKEEDGEENGSGRGDDDDVG